ncbi:MAG: molybdopterin-dependent oxidoreductase [Chloroflexi bacterium]|nr:molybdopterin-dependent oxidoreductase [Chloroflexota bacterium]
MSKTVIPFVLNGEKVELAVDPRRRLLDVLREDLGLTGAKEGCGTGECGSCKVIVDGRAVSSCLLQVGKIAHKQVTTIEGLGNPSRPHPLQEAFVEAGAVQCGFCTPGMIMAAWALLERNHDPTQRQVREALAGNLCRCTGYTKIIEAVQRTATHLRGEGMEERRWGEGMIGRGVPRLDALYKATGVTRYTADLQMEGMLYARVLRSPHHHARIRLIDTREAEALEGVVAVLTAKDIPGANRIGQQRKDQSVLAEDRVRQVGDAVAVVAAHSETAAAKALSLIKVDYELLEPVFDPLKALQEGAPPVHEGGNLVAQRRVIKGDVEKGFSQADVVVENTYTTPFIEHAYLEPEAGLCHMDEAGRVVLRVPTQGAHSNREEICRVLGLGLDRVRVIQMPTGGAFGGKGEITVHCLLALLSYKTGMPVKMVYSRRESFESTTKAQAFHMRYRTGASRDGKLFAVQAELVLNSGAYASVGEATLTRAVVHATGPYNVPHIFVEGKLVYTNNPYCGAMRGFGVSQVTFACESQMDILADRIGMDPWEFRFQNAYDRGDENSTGQVLKEGVGIKETLKAVRPYYQQRLARAKAPARAPERTPWKEGMGLACSWKGIGRLGGSNRSEAHVELKEDGRVYIFTGACDVGQGSSTVLAQIAAHELCVPLEGIVIISGDTDLTPDAGATSASRVTYMSGNAVKSAAGSLREALLATSARVLEKPVEDLRLDQGYLTSLSEPALRLSLEELAAYCREAGMPLRYEGIFDTPRPQLDPQTGQGIIYNPNVYASLMARVKVNVKTGEVRVLEAIAAQDVGKAIHPLNVEGQVEGGVAMGLGFALKEEFLPGRTRGFRQYRIPNTRDVPRVIPIIVEVPAPLGPYGAKGAGENSNFTIAPAIINAIYNACGVRLFHLPAIPQRVLAALREKSRCVVCPSSNAS